MRVWALEHVCASSHCLLAALALPDADDLTLDSVLQNRESGNASVTLYSPVFEFHCADESLAVDTRRYRGD